jgi:hypothetical protein
MYLVMKAFVLISAIASFHGCIACMFRCSTVVRQVFTGVSEELPVSVFRAMTV